MFEKIVVLCLFLTPWVMFSSLAEAASSSYVELLNEGVVMEDTDIPNLAESRLVARTAVGSNMHVIARLTSNRGLTGSPHGTVRVEPNLNNNQRSIRARVSINNSNGTVSNGPWSTLPGSGASGTVSAGESITTFRFSGTTRNGSVWGHAAGMNAAGTWNATNTSGITWN